jgi:hypothetical protein
MPEDPVVTSGRREALFTLGLWLAATLYTVGYCTLYGYGSAADAEQSVLWFPAWVFWGIVVPWLACTAISCWFALCVMQDAPLVRSDDAPPDDAPSDRDSSAGAGPSAQGTQP